MTKPTAAKTPENPGKEEAQGETFSPEKKLDQLYSLIDGIETAMMTTRASDGGLVSRPMQVQARETGTDLWFMTVVGSGKLAEIEADPQVNLSFYKDRSREWVSVKGVARVSQDKERIRQLYKADWKAWLPDEGGDRNGSPEDPRIALIEVDAVSATYLKSDQPTAVKLFNIARAVLTGTTPKLGVMGSLGRATLDSGAARDQK
jgi:general stress protein 26